MPFDIRQLLDLAAPAIGGLAAGDPGKSAAFMQGFQQAQAHIQQEKQRQAEAALKQRQVGAQYLMQIGEHANAIDDPVAFDNFIRLAEDAGTKAGYVQPGELAKAIPFNTSQRSAARLKELTDQLGQLEKSGYNLDDLSQSGAQLSLKDGQHIPISAAIELTRARPTDASGQPIAKPSKADTAAPTDYSRFLARYAKDKGKKSEDLTAAEELDARKQFSTVDDKPPAPVDAQIQTLRDLQIEGQRLRNQNLKNPKAAQATTPAEGALTDEGLDYAATQYRITGQMPSLGMGKTPDRGRLINRAAQQAKELGQTPAAAIQKQAAFKGDSAALAQMQKMSASAQSFENKALAQADIVRDLSAKVDRTQWPVINKAIVAGKINLLGDKDAQLLANAITTFTAEYAKIMEGSTGSAAASSDSARAAANRLISAQLNKGTLAATLDLMQREMALTVQGYDATIDHISTRMGGAPATPTAVTPSQKIGRFDVAVEP